MSIKMRKQIRLSQTDIHLANELIENIKGVNSLTELLSYLIKKEHKRTEERKILSELDEMMKKISEIDRSFSIYHEQFDLHMDGLDVGCFDPERDLKKKAVRNYEKKIKKNQTRKHSRKYF